MQLIRGRVIASEVHAEVAGVEHVKPWIAVHARVPFLTEKLAVGWNNFLVKSFRQGYQVGLVVANAVLNPEIDVVADVTQGSLDLEIFVCVGVGCPKAFLSSDFIGGFGIDQHIRHVEFSA